LEEALINTFELKNVHFHYKGKTALKNISLAVTRGESLGIVGESGSGKTTLLLLLLRLLSTQTGAITFAGKDLSGLTKTALQDFRRRVQPVFQDPFLSLDPTQRVGSAIAEPLRSLRLAANREERRERVAAALQSVGLDEDTARHFPAEFSGGQRQRIAIARALVTNPEVLIADEPVSALDIITKIEILKLLHRLKENRNFTLIMVSHDLPVVADIAERIIVIDQGELIEDAPTHTLLTAPQHPRTQALLNAAFTAL
jgi:peptide/nickel transport system ATP-binding protein